MRCTPLTGGNVEEEDSLEAVVVVIAVEPVGVVTALFGCATRLNDVDLPTGGGGMMFNDDAVCPRCTGHVKGAAIEQEHDDIGFGVFCVFVPV